MIILILINIKTKNKLIINEELNFNDSTNEFLRNVKQINDMYLHITQTLKVKQITEFF